MCIVFLCYLHFFFLMIRQPPISTRTYPLFPYPTLFRSDGTFAYDTSQGISNLGFGISASKDFGSQLQKGLSQGSSVVDQKRVAASDSWAATRTESARLFDTAQTSASATTEEGRSQIGRAHV